jgi:hypothetical protein
MNTTFLQPWTNIGDAPVHCFIATVYRVESTPSMSRSSDVVDD